MNDKLTPLLARVLVFALLVRSQRTTFWALVTLTLKTTFLQCETYAEFRDIICQLPPESGLPPHMGARLKRPAYGLNDAPRRWWNIIDRALRSYGMVPTRADRCCYVLYSSLKKKSTRPVPQVARAIQRYRSGHCYS